MEVSGVSDLNVNGAQMRTEIVVNECDIILNKCDIVLNKSDIVLNKSVSF